MTVMLYRAASEPNPQVWDLCVEHRVFAAEDIAEAIADGWARHPHDVGAVDEPSAEVVQLQPKRRGRPPKEG